MRQHEHEKYSLEDMMVKAQQITRVPFPQQVGALPMQAATLPAQATTNGINIDAIMNLMLIMVVMVMMMKMMGQVGKSV